MRSPSPPPYGRICFAIFINFGHPKCNVDVLAVAKVSFVSTDREMWDSSAIDVDFQKILSYNTSRAFGLSKNIHFFFFPQMLMFLCSMTDFWRQMLQNKLMSHFLQHFQFAFKPESTDPSSAAWGIFFNVRFGSNPLWRATIHAKFWDCCRFGLHPLSKFRRFCLGILTWAYLHFSFGNRKKPKYTYEENPLVKYATCLSCAETISGLSALQVVIHALTPIVFTGLHV